MTTLRIIKGKVDSPIANRFAPCRGYTRGRYKPRNSYAAIVVHTTGSGVVSRFARQGERFGDASVFDTAVRVYQTLMDASGHYVLGAKGQCVQLCPEEQACWGVGSTHRVAGIKRKSAKVYNGKWHRPHYGWWNERWFPLFTPLELAKGEVWDGGMVNPNVIHIETEYGFWTPAMWATFIALVRDIRKRRQIPNARNRLLTHADVHPIARTGKGLPRDLALEHWRYQDFAKRTHCPCP